MKQNNTPDFLSLLLKHLFHKHGRQNTKRVAYFSYEIPWFELIFVQFAIVFSYSVKTCVLIRSG